MISSLDHQIRTAAFSYVERVTSDGERPITWTQLNSFTFGGEIVHLVSQQGIFKPRMLSIPISIRTAPVTPGIERPYDDDFTAEGYVAYNYRGTDPNHQENRLLRAAMENGVPLLYLRGVAKGLYDATGAVILGANDATLTFTVAEVPLISMVEGSAVNLDTSQRRHYVTMVRRRANQAAFRSVVLQAYRKQCALCRIKHIPLLDAAHIVSDRDGGEPVVTNGLAMCKIHHAAYDSNILGIRPDLVAEIRNDVLQEIDGPMLRHGLQDMHGTSIIVPRRSEWRPDAAAVERRFEEFRAAG